MITIVKMKKKNDKINGNDIIMITKKKRSTFKTRKILKARDIFTRYFIVERGIPI